MNTRILCVDDDSNVLAGFRRSLRGRFTLDTATSGAAALEKIEAEGPYAVIVADMNMPNMNGVQFLTQVRKRYPETVRIMLTGNADQQTAMAAVNHGSVYQFLTKPCPPDMLAKTLEMGLKQYQLVVAERELLEDTLNGSIKVLADVIAIAHPDAFKETKSVVKYSTAIARHLGLANLWEIEIAATVAQVGLVAVPPDTIKRRESGEPLSEADVEMLDRVPELGSQLLGRIPRLQNVASFVRFQSKRFDGGGVPRNETAGEDIPIGARILKVATDFCHLAAKQGATQHVVEEMQAEAGAYDPKVLSVLESVIQQDPADSFEETVRIRVPLEQVEEGDLIVDPVKTENDMILVCGGTVVTAMLKEKLANFAQLMSDGELLLVERKVISTEVSESA